jgi:hypothetical protein
MDQQDRWERLLKRSLTPNIEPDEQLNVQLIRQLREASVHMRSSKVGFRKKLVAGVASAVLFVTMSFTVYAAWNYLNPAQVADSIGDRALAQAFVDEHAVQLNESVTSGDYRITLHGIVSGEGISDFVTSSSAEHFQLERTYAVVSIAKRDGSAMPDIHDEAYDKMPFFVTPLIKGVPPWQVNIATMNGGYSEIVKDGVMYRLIETDGIEMFADRGVYLAVSSSRFYDTNAFHYQEETGEISVNSEYGGVNALFELPLDPAKADPDRAEAYLQQMLPSNNTDSDRDAVRTEPDMEAAVEQGTLIAESVKVMDFDENGMGTYEYENYLINIALDALFEDGQTGFSKLISTFDDEQERFAVRFARDADGVVTGMMYKLN